MSSSTSGNAAAEVVPNDELAPLLRAWRERYAAQNDTDYELGDHLYRDKACVFGPIQYLAWHSGVNPRQINAVLREQTKTTSFANAERLLMAIDREYMLGNGDVSVLPNPAWKFGTYIRHLLTAGC